MAGSANDARFRAQVLDIVRGLQVGRLTTHQAIGDELDVPARHVAYILSREDDPAVPVHRVVREDGSVGGGRRAAALRVALQVEGVPLDDRGRVTDLEARFERPVLDAESRADPATPLARSPLAER